MTRKPLDEKYALASAILINVIARTLTEIESIGIPDSADKHDTILAQSIKVALSHALELPNATDLHNLSHHCMTLREIYAIELKNIEIQQELAQLKKIFSEYH